MITIKLRTVLLILFLVASYSLHAQLLSEGAVIDSVTLRSSVQYEVGLAYNFRFSPLNTSYGLVQQCWCRHEAGISVMRYPKGNSNRVFWMAGVGYSTEVVNQQRVADIRLVSGGTNTPQTEEVGTKTEQYDYHYVTVPISVNYLVFNSKNTNLYVGGEAAFDWLSRFELERNATYDGRTNRATRARFTETSVTLSAGVGVYQPIGSKLTLLLGIYRGYTFLSDFEDRLNVRRGNGITTLNMRLHYRI